jgi:hypothetical protein
LFLFCRTWRGTAVNSERCSRNPMQSSGKQSKAKLSLPQMPPTHSREQSALRDLTILHLLELS